MTDHAIPGLSGRLTGDAQHRGGAPVGHLSDLGPVEGAAVVSLRMWCGGAETYRRMCDDFATSMGPRRGRKALESLGSLCDLFARHGRRPLIRHQVACRCLGADESCFATLIGYASEGAREDALLLSMTLVRPDMAGLLAGLAEEFGLALRQSILAGQKAPLPDGRIVH